jgi:exodeoxyribonuclease VII small subunit
MARQKQIPPKSFEDALEELERILSDIEAGEVPLEQSLTMYERGQFLIQHCRTILGRAEKQIEVLSRNESGELTSQPMAEAGDAEADADTDPDDDEGEGES